MNHPIDIGVEIAKFHCPMYKSSMFLSDAWSVERLLLLHGRAEAARIMTFARDAMQAEWQNISVSDKSDVLFGIAFVGYVYHMMRLDTNCVPMLLVDMQRAMKFQAHESVWWRAFDVATKLSKEWQRKT